MAELETSEHGSPIRKTMNFEELRYGDTMDMGTVIGPVAYLI